MDRIKTLTLSLLMIALLFSFAACGKNNAEIRQPELRVSDQSGMDRLEEIKLTGKLIVATVNDYPPYEYRDKDSDVGVSGSDIELAMYIAEELGVELQLYITDFDDVLKLAASGEADLGIAAISPTEERKETMAFSLSYDGNYQIGLMAVTQEFADANGIVVGGESAYANGEEAPAATEEAQSAASDDGSSTEENGTGADIAEINKENFTIGSVEGSIQQRYAIELIPYAKQVSVKKISEGIELLKTGDIDFLALEAPTGESYIERTQGITMTSYVLDTPTGETAVAMCTGQDSLCNEINAIIEKMMVDDLYSEWLDQYRAIVEENDI